ncbi:MAG: acyltransferase [Cognatishimia sp.]|nr:acyltransferase [Cognatishimia sp.]
MTTMSRLAWLDCLRLLAAVSMLILHCTADANGGAWVDYDEPDRIAPLLIRTFAYAARTELFIIISLFLLMMSLEKRPRGYRETIAEQAQRLLVPFAFWTVFYAFFSLIKAYHFGYLDAKLAALGDIRTWVSFALLGTSKYHMHFLPTLFCVVLAYPLMRKAVKVPALGGFALVIYLVSRWQLDQFIYPRFWDDPNILAIGRSVKIATHIGYGMVAASCLGLWQKQSQKDLESWFLPTIYFATLIAVFKFLGTWETIDSGRWSHNYQPGYWADFTMPAILILVCMLMGYRSWSARFSHYAKYAIGIYLCHPIFLDFCEIYLNGTRKPPIVQVAIKIAMTLPSTIICVLLLSRVSALSWTIGLGQLPRLPMLFRLDRRPE